MDHTDQALEHWAAVMRCEAAVLRFTAHFDAREYHEMERYFAPDGLWKRHEGDVRGVIQLRERMAQFKPDFLMRHVITNMRTTLHSRQTATVDSYVTLYMHVYGDAVPPLHAPLNGPVVVGRYVDDMRCIDGDWKIQIRQPIHDFKTLA